MERIVSATEARIHFGELMRQAVETRRPIIVEHGGQARVIILAVSEYERLQQGQAQADWKTLIQQARAQARADLSGRRLPPPEEVLSQLREARDEQLVDLC